MKDLRLRVTELYRKILEKEQFIDVLAGKEVTAHFKEEARRLKFKYVFLRENVPCDADFRLIENMTEYVDKIELR